jgi:hypothetical protein
MSTHSNLIFLLLNTDPIEFLPPFFTEANENRGILSEVFDPRIKQRPCPAIFKTRKPKNSSKSIRNPQSAIQNSNSNRVKAVVFQA